MFTLEKIIQLLIAYKYYFLLPIATIEGPIVSVIAGFLSSRGYLDFTITYIILMVGDVVGDAIFYSIGRWGGNAFIRKFGRYLRIDENKLMRAEKYFHIHGGKTLLFGKTQPLGGLILLAAGVAKMPFWKFIGYNTGGTIVKSFLLIILGYYFGEGYALINQYMGLTSALITLFSFILIVGFILYRRSKKQI